MEQKEKEWKGDNEGQEKSEKVNKKKSGVGREQQRRAKGKTGKEE